jgi:hypothetical protein
MCPSPSSEEYDSFAIAPDCQEFPNTSRSLTGDLFQPQFMTIERRDVLNRFMGVP